MCVCVLHFVWSAKRMLNAKDDEIHMSFLSEYLLFHHLNKDFNMHASHTHIQYKHKYGQCKSLQKETTL